MRQTSARMSKRMCPGRPGVGPTGARPSPWIWAASATLRVIARLRTTSVATTASPSGRWLNIVATKTLLGILASVEFIDREGAEGIGDAFEGAQFAKERTRLDVGSHEVLPRPVERHPQAAGQDKIDLAVVLRLTGHPGARRRLEPGALPIENPTGFWTKRFETGMC